MSKPILRIGLDVHDLSIIIALACCDSEFRHYGRKRKRGNGALVVRLLMAAS